MPPFCDGLPAGNATDILPLPWFEVCQRAYELCRTDNAPDQAPAPALAAASRPLTAMEYLTGNSATSLPPARPASFLERLLPWLKRQFGKGWSTRRGD